MEYKYIIQEVIDKGVITATSLDVYNKVEHYNEIMRKMRRKKQIIHYEFDLVYYSACFGIYVS